MADINEFPDVPGYVSIKQAAQILGITDKRVYRYIDLGRLPAYKSGGVFLLVEEDVKQFKLNPPGRARTVPPRWRVYHTRSKVLATEIQVPVSPGQQERLVEKLAAIQQANRHTFPGTIARYIMKGDAELTSIHFCLVWKDTEMPDESMRERSLEALQEELADVLEWERAQYSTNEALMHTWQTWFMIIHSDISGTFLNGNACFTRSINGIKVKAGVSLWELAGVLASLEGVGQQYETHVTALTS